MRNQDQFCRICNFLLMFLNGMRSHEARRSLRAFVDPGRARTRTGRIGTIPQTNATFDPPASAAKERHKISYVFIFFDLHPRGLISRATTSGFRLCSRFYNPAFAESILVVGTLTDTGRVSDSIRKACANSAVDYG